ncbi:sacsin N-terminal ATP-binding-like domain-containing protein [Mucilaginibacter gossypii]|uniref:DUF3883 domain-containing protein n=1 Tax=Mucilaginibacter gossypii TaxID=551996 RepID=A0A1G8CT34_9SPHI|nr:hypothetical protein [Mucilaginibacter gossypii]SDH48433.1 hypothetical protein SAMN05192573_11029 [Mucilaginibacter gossypii]
MNEVLTPAKLQQIVADIFKYNQDKNEYDRISDRNVQQLFATSYQTRYFLELIQNARDAIVEGGKGAGKVKTWVANDTLFFANNGVPFDEKGVQSLCYPAVSRKDSKEFIGHKGIGFNAVLEITDRPEVITEVGTFYFNVEDAADELVNWKPIDIALFRFPMFRSASISDLFPDLAAQGFTTIFALPLNNEFKNRIDQIEQNVISGADLVFLEFIKEIDLFDSFIHLNDVGATLQVIEDEEPTEYHIYQGQVVMSDEDIATFAEEEQTIFRDTDTVECKFLLQVNDDGRFEPRPDSKLHLYYAMKFTTGFAFSIHSLFSVTLERKGLHETSKLNKKLFKGIAEYYCGIFLTAIKQDFPDQVLEVMAYERHPNNNLGAFYDEIKKNLRQQELIYHGPSARFCCPSEILLVSNKEYELCRDGFLGDYCLMVVPSNWKIKKWLIDECGVSELTNAIFASKVEEKCIQYINEPGFFQSVYDYAITKQIDLSRKAILLTQGSGCVTGNQTAVYYQDGTSLKAPQVLEDSVSFLSDSIKLTGGPAEQNKFLGVKNFTARNLIDIALDVLKRVQKDEVGRRVMIELIEFLVQFDELQERDHTVIAQSVELPVYHLHSGQRSWRSPAFLPIYFEDFDFAEDYDRDLWALNWDAFDLGDMPKNKWRELFEAIGIWTIPGLTLVAETVFEDETGAIMTVQRDRVLHVPQKLSPRFSQMLLENWEVYRNEIVLDQINKAIVVNNTSYGQPSYRFKNSSFYRTLWELEWIFAKLGDTLTPKSPSDVIFMNSKESGKLQSRIFYDYFPVCELNETLYKEAISDLELMHLNYEDNANYMRILCYFAASYPEIAQDADGTKFEKCYNRLLYLLTEYYHSLKGRSYVGELKKIPFLSRHITTQEYAWTPGEDCIHINEKILLDELLLHGLTDKLAHQFAFTKRDKRDWGRYAKDIGKPLTKLVTFAIKGEGEPKPLIELTPHIALLTAIVEDDLDESFDDGTLLIMKEMNVYVHKPLEIVYTFGNGDHEADIRQIVFTEGEEEDTEVALSINALTTHRDLAIVLQDFFEHFTNEELKRINLLFERILRILHRRTEVERFLSECNIDQTRLDHISEILAQPYFVEPNTIAAPVMVSTSPVTAKPRIVTKTTIVQEPVEITEVEQQGTFHDYTNLLSQHISNQAEEFQPAIPNPASNSAHTISGGSSGGFGVFKPRRRLADDLMKDVGMFAEHHIYQRLQQGEVSLLQKLGISEAVAAAVHWFNILKLEDDDIDDQSIGHGHDFYHAGLDLALEIKGMMAQTPFITLTGPELESMRLRRGNYHLIIVKNIFDPPNIRPLVISDPWGKIMAGELRFMDANLYI